METELILQGSQLTILTYIALDLSQIKRAMKESDAIEYQKPAIFTEFLPMLRKG